MLFISSCLFVTLLRFHLNFVAFSDCLFLSRCLIIYYYFLRTRAPTVYFMWLYVTGMEWIKWENFLATLFSLLVFFFNHGRADYCNPCSLRIFHIFQCAKVIYYYYWPNLPSWWSSQRKKRIRVAVSEYATDLYRATTYACVCVHLLIPSYCMFASFGSNSADRIGIITHQY